MADVITPQKPYKWGKAQGIVMLLIGVPAFLAAPFLKSPPAYLVGAFFTALGVGLLGRKRFGIVLIFVLCFLLGLGGLQAEGEARIVNLAFSLFILPSAIFYYPKRWNEFS